MSGIPGIPGMQMNETVVKCRDMLMTKILENDLATVAGSPLVKDGGMFSTNSFFCL